MHLQVLHSGQKALLEEFVAGHPQGSIEQTWAWGELQTQIPGRSAFRVFGLFEGEQLLGSMLVIQQEMGFGKTWLWCPRGPLLPVGLEEEGWEMLQEACGNWARLQGNVFLRVESGVLREEEMVVKGKEAQECYLPEDTLILDLVLSEEELLKQMSQKGRYHIKTAEKCAVKVERAGEKDLGEFYRLLEETAERDGFFVHKESFYKAFFKKLEAKAVFYVARVGEKVVGGALMVHFGDTATYYFGASSGAHREVKAANALQWFAIRDAKKAGFAKYDFLGIAPESPLDHVLSGVTQFKMSFGGRRVTYQKAQVFVYRRFWWWAYRIAKRLRG